MFTPRYLVISLGNPLPKYASLHSAGHFALNGLAKVLRNPAFREVTYAKNTCMVSAGPKYTLVQSPTLMNISGPFVQNAWLQMIKEVHPKLLSLVIIHDELEKDLGVVRMVEWTRSPKGHNGIKSVRNAFRQKDYPESPLVRIAVGIGRPVERDAATVSRYVLDRISGEQRRVLEEEAPWAIAEKLVELENEWKSQFEP